jgi:hypothetical protein
MNKFTKIAIGAHLMMTAIVVGTFIALMTSPHEE